MEVHYVFIYFLVFIFFIKAFYSNLYYYIEYNFNFVKNALTVAFQKANIPNVHNIICESFYFSPILKN